MSIALGPKLQLLYNSSIGETYYDELRLFLQAIDTLVQLSVISATVSAPPVSPNGGDAYLLLGGTPTDSWTGFAGYVAVWDAQWTTPGTNTQIPQWVFYKPNAGWLVWTIATNSLAIFDGTNWTSVTQGGSQAEAPTGAVNGSNRNYTLSFSPEPVTTFQLFLNGVLQLPSLNYTLSGTNISMNIAPTTGSTLYAMYAYV